MIAKKLTQISEGDKDLTYKADDGLRFVEVGENEDENGRSFW